MQIAQIPFNEQQRLANLLEYDILDTPAESDFDELVELASQICECPISIITLLEKDRQWFKSIKGAEASETERKASFCSHAILQDNVLVVENATLDPRFCNNPFVTGEANVRFYAGAPIISPDGFKLGTICVVDSEPRTFSASQERALQLLSNHITKLLELRKKNKEIRRRAEEIAIMKSQAIVEHLRQTETTRKEIAYDLHEKFAQDIASGLMFLKMAEEQPAKAPEIICSVREQFLETLCNVRDLAYKVNPLNCEWLSTSQVASEFFNRIGITYPFKLNYTSDNSAYAVNPDITLAALRVTEDWLNRLSYKKMVSEVEITVSVDSNLTITVKDNHNQESLTERENEILKHIVCDQVNAFGGEVSIVQEEDKTIIFGISLPLAVNIGRVVPKTGEVRW